jgi:hypothetical protein
MESFTTPIDLNSSKQQLLQWYVRLGCLREYVATLHMQIMPGQNRMTKNLLTFYINLYHNIQS